MFSINVDDFNELFVNTTIKVNGDEIESTPIQFKNCVDRFGKIILNELKKNSIDCWIAGGIVRDYFSSIPLKGDFDLFFPNKEEMEKCLMFLKKSGAEVVWESDNGSKLKYNGIVIDVVKHYFKTPEECINNFDFTISMFAVDNKTVYYGKTSFIDLAKKQLMINKITYPASTMRRILKYVKNGYWICNGELRKVIESIQKMEIKSTNVINDNKTIDKLPVISGEEKDDNKPNVNDVTSFDDFFIGID